MKEIIVIIFFFLAAANIFGQVDTDHPECTISINRMMYNNKYIVDKYGFGISGRNPLKLNNYLDLVQGLDFNMNSFYAEGAEIATSHLAYYCIISTIRFFSLDLSLLIRAHTNGKIKYFTSDGFYLATNLGGFSKAVEYINTPTTYSKDTVFIVNGITTIDYGSSMNIGCMIPLKKKYLILKVTYNYGFRKLEVDDNFDIYRRFISFGAGIKF